MSSHDLTSCDSGVSQALLFGLYLDIVMSPHDQLDNAAYTLELEGGKAQPLEII